MKKAVKDRQSRNEASPEEDIADSEQLQDFIKAEMMWIQESQQGLTEDRHFPTWKKQFGLYCEGGVWRCGGRLQLADLTQSEKHPIILPREHHLTKLIVLRAHDKVYHNGTKETLTEVRSKFWIIKGRSLVKKLIHECRICRRHEGPHYQVPPPPPLPEYRVSRQSPFESTGVDFAGPLYVRYLGKNETSKVWLCLFTCAVIRAVHLDLVPDMSATSFVRCLKRFVARKGIPRRFISDNAQTFKCTEKMLKSMVKQREVHQYLMTNKILWIFNVERAPWWGGLFERMVKSTKRCLRKVIGRSKLYYDELLTILVDVEGVINSRPLTYMAADDLDEPLTPSHFLYGRRILTLPDGLTEDEDSDEFSLSQPSEFNRRLKHLNLTLNKFWQRWRSEYLIELRNSHRYHGGRTDATPPSVEDVVMIHEDDKPRGLWRLGRITKLIIGKDGHVRGAVLRVSGDRTLQRPIQKLFPLEISEQQAKQQACEMTMSEGQLEDSESGETRIQHDSISDDSSKESQDKLDSRPQRAAAIDARNRLAAYASMDTD